MKKVILLLSLFFVFSSCEKEDDPITQQDQKDSKLIIGTWKFDALKFDIQTNNQEVEDYIKEDLTMFPPSLVSLTFTEDSVFFTYNNKEEAYRYYLKENTLFIEEYIILSNNEIMYAWVDYLYFLDEQSFSYLIDETPYYRNFFLHHNAKVNKVTKNHLFKR